jgi:hypothetical protein
MVSLVAGESEFPDIPPGAGGCPGRRRDTNNRPAQGCSVAIPILFIDFITGSSKKYSGSRHTFSAAAGEQPGPERRARTAVLRAGLCRRTRAAPGAHGETGNVAGCEFPVVVLVMDGFQNTLVPLKTACAA